MNNIKHVICACALWALAWFALIQPIAWASNLFAFITWTLLVMFLTSLNQEGRKRIIQTHRDGKHAPAWFDHLTYLTIVLTCAATGHYVKAAAWFITYSIDISHREEAKKP